MTLADKISQDRSLTQFHCCDLLINFDADHGDTASEEAFKNILEEACQTLLARVESAKRLPRQVVPSSSSLEQEWKRKHRERKFERSIEQSTPQMGSSSSYSQEEDTRGQAELD